MIGIKGAGMAGLAQILKNQGYKVTGSDVKDKFFTDNVLKQAGIKYHQKFSTKNLPKSQNAWLISSDAYLAPRTDNPEIKKLRKRRMPITSYSEAVAELFNKKFGIAVTGTHGKTTTAALVAHILKKAGKNPTALIGGEVLNWNSNALAGKSEFFVLEADEYREQFLKYRPNIIAITNVDYDHPDYFQDPKVYRTAFNKFIKKLKPGGKVFRNSGQTKPALKTKLIGKHNQENIYLAKTIARYLGLPEETIRKAIAQFKGVRRRLEKIGIYKNNIIIDDYAHNPEKVMASLTALKETYRGKKISVIFQPHTFSRTEKFLKKFAKTLTFADHIYLLKVYGSAREKRGLVGSDELVKEIKKLRRLATNLKTIDEAVKFCRKGKMPKGVWVTMGAGDVFRMAYKLCGIQK